MNERPWERRKGESAIAYLAFLAYRDLGPTRNLTEAQKAHTAGMGKQKGTKSHNVGEWSAKHEWVERCRAWDNHLQAQRDEVLASDAAKWQQRVLDNREANFELASRLRDRANELLAHPIVQAKGKGPNGEIIVQPAGWTQKDIAAIGKTASELAASALEGFRDTLEEHASKIDDTALLEDPDEVRRLELHKLDLMAAAIWPKVMAGDRAAAETSLKIMEMRVKYLGITPPIPPQADSPSVAAFGEMVEKTYGDHQVSNEHPAESPAPEGLPVGE